MHHGARQATRCSWPPTTGLAAGRPGRPDPRGQLQQRRSAPRRIRGPATAAAGPRSRPRSGAAARGRPGTRSRCAHGAVRASASSSARPGRRRATLTLPSSARSGRQCSSAASTCPRPIRPAARQTRPRHPQRDLVEHLGFAIAPSACTPAGRCGNAFSDQRLQARRARRRNASQEPPRGAGCCAARSAGAWPADAWPPRRVRPVPRSTGSPTSSACHACR